MRLPSPLMRLTTQQQILLEELAKANHPTACELYEMVRKRLPRIGLGTMYRQLELMADNGIILKLGVGGSQKRFDAITRPHYHIRCSACSKVENIEMDVIHDLGKAVETSYHFLGHNAEFTGLCPECQKKSSSPEAEEHIELSSMSIRHRVIQNLRYGSMTSSVQDIINVLSPDAAHSLPFLAVPPYLDNELAAGILVKSGVANSNASELLEEIRSFPIWHEKGKTSWGLDDDVREYVLSKLNGSGESTRRTVLNALREVRQPSPDSILHEFDLQLARLSLTIEQEQQNGIAVLRQFFNLHHDETSRVVDLYIEESLPAEVPADRRLPDHLHSAYFMRGIYAYRNRRSKDALRFLEPVWKRHSGSPESCHDAAVAAHIVGLIWSKKARQHKNAETAFKESLDLGKDDSHHQAQVWHSLGSLLSRNRQRHQEAETAFKESLDLGKDDSHYQAQVWHSLGNLLSHDHQRHDEAETAYRKSLELEELNRNTFGQVQVLHSLGNLLSRDHQRHQEAEDAYRESLELEGRNGRQLGRAQLWHSIGNLLSRTRQRNEEAETAYRKSLELGKDNPHHQAQVRHSLGNLLSRDRKRWPEAEELYQKSYQFLSKSGDRRGVAMVSSSFCRMLMQKGDYDQAEHWLHIALDNERIDYFRDKIKAQLEELA